jgi:hypothetical protein
MEVQLDVYNSIATTDPLNLIRRSARPDYVPTSATPKLSIICKLNILRLSYIFIGCHGFSVSPKPS